MTEVRKPVVSVIVPVRNSAEMLSMTLARLRESDYTDYELLVVDDASTDDTPSVAAKSGARLVNLKEQSGPAAARNRGAHCARGDYLVFIDADVCVHPDTLGRIVDRFETDPRLDAVFGSYDAQPAAPGLLSQYKNLQHHFVHQQGHGPASTFWAGCGAVRRSVFLEMGGFDASFRRPCIEDIELGVRMWRSGRKIALDKNIQVTHLKRWTLSGILKADILHRAVPWSQLIVREGAMPNTLNLRGSQRACALLALGLLMCIAAAGLWFPPALLLPLGTFALLALLDRLFSPARMPTMVGAICLLGELAGAGALAWHFQWWSLLPLACLTGLVVLNRRFYLFLSRVHNPVFAALVLPMHILYYVYGTATFAAVSAMSLFGLPRKGAAGKQAEPAEPATLPQTREIP